MDSGASGMVDLRERLSEFSYGYGVTREAQKFLELEGMKATPFLPNLIHENQLGFDVSFNDAGRLFALQFKLGEELTRFHRGKHQTTAPDLDRPFWRFNVDVNSDQFVRLYDLELSGAETFYAAPRFRSWTEYEWAFRNERVLKKSMLIRPSEIHHAIASAGSTSSRHRVVYDTNSKYVCSEPVKVHDSSAYEQLQSRLESNFASSRLPLWHLVRSAYARSAERGILTVPEVELPSLNDRYPKDTNERFAIDLGYDAWAHGIQMIFATFNG